MIQPKKNKAEDPRLLKFIDITKRYFNKLKMKYTLGLYVIFISVIIGGMALLTLAEYFLYLSSPAKLILISTLLFIAGGSMYLIKKRIFLPSYQSFYHRFAKRFDLQALGHALDLHFEKKHFSSLRSAAIRQNLDNLNLAKVRESLSSHLYNQQIARVMRKGYVSLVLSATFLLSFAIYKPQGINRLVHFWKSYSPPNPYTYKVEPGSVTLEQGNAFIPSIKFKDKQPGELILAFKTDVEEAFRERSPSSIENKKASFRSINLASSGEYYFLMDGFKSKTYRAEVQLLPRFESLTVMVRPPAYTNLDTTRYSYPFSQIQAYRGSGITIRASANKLLSELYLIKYQSEDTLSLQPENGRTFTYELKVLDNDTLAFSMKDLSGLSNKNSFEIVLETLEDESPFVQIVSPESDIEMKTPEDLALQYEASDDFGLLSAHLTFELQRAFTSASDQQSIKIPIPDLNQSQTYQWQVKQLNPKPRDIISYWIEVQDNDKINGSKKARSRTLTITFPSLTSYMDELENKERNVQKELENISDSYRQMQKEYDRFKEQLKENPQGDWEQKQSLDQIQEQQKDIDKKVEELNKEFEKIREEIEKSGLMSEETLKAYDELQELMKEIADPELAKALEELQKAMGNFNQQQLREALENFEFSEQQYQERLKRTLELFKTLKLNSDLEKMAKAFDELSKEEQELSENSQDASEERSKQEAVQKDLERLEKELKKLSENPPQKAREEIKKLQKDIDNDLESVKKKLKENIEQLKNTSSQSNSNKVNQQQKRIQEQLNQMSEQMRSARQQLNQQQKQINIAALRYILHSLINLSQKQEELTRETEHLANGSQAFVEKARIEQQIREQFSQIADSLFRISSEIPRFSNTINEKKNVVQQQLATAVDQLAERNKSQSTFAERQSLGGINELSTMIASLLDQLQKSQGQGGGAGSMTMQQFMEQMQQMSGRQQMLNKQIQNFINDIQGDRLSKDQVQRLNQMARQQNQIRKQIEELRKNGGLESGDRVLSDLERLSEQMEETINDLRGGQADPPLIKRQQNILSRMLNAEKALQERGQEEKREATTAEEAPKNVPPEVTLEELEKKIRTLLNDPNRTKFSEDYQRLIEQYFKLLKYLNTDNDSTSIN